MVKPTQELKPTNCNNNGRFSQEHLKKAGELETKWWKGDIRDNRIRIEIAQALAEAEEKGYQRGIKETEDKLDVVTPDNASPEFKKIMQEMGIWEKEMSK